MLSKIEETIKQRLDTYFASPAYLHKLDTRFVSLQIVLRDIAAGLRGKVVSLYGLSLPSTEQIDRITDCSTCPGKAPQTAAARTMCESFAMQWLRFSKPKTEGIDLSSKISRKPPITQSGVKKNNEQPPKQVFFNIQAFKTPEQ